MDISCVHRAGTFDYRGSVLDGSRRYLVHGEMRESRTEAEVEGILQRAREPFPPASPRSLSPHGPQFIARDFQKFIRIGGMPQVGTSPFSPQSNGKIERGPPSRKAEGLRPGVPLSIEEARRWVGRYVNPSHRLRLPSGIGSVPPLDKREGREGQILAERERQREEARPQRKLHPQEAWAKRNFAGVSSAVPLNGTGRVKRKLALQGSHRAPLCGVGSSSRAA